MDKIVNQFIDYLNTKKKLSASMIVSYQRDLLNYIDFLKSQNVTEINHADTSFLNDYITFLEKQGRKASTIMRNVASVRKFNKYLLKHKLINEDSAENIRTIRIEKNEPETLTQIEMELILSQPTLNCAIGIRDKAMMELLYATGIRVTELTSLKIYDVNLSVGYIKCSNGKKERIIPIGRTAKKALVQYMNGSREEFIKNEASEYLFLTRLGDMMTRQGFWKTIKSYAQKAMINKEITPHTFRHSFASHMVENGADLKCLQEMLGHTALSTTQIYTHFNNKKMRAEYIKSHPRA